jgi:hypothetical protein
MIDKKNDDVREVKKGKNGITESKLQIDYMDFDGILIP